MLKEFGSGWINSFAKPISILQETFPDIIINNIYRKYGMLYLDIAASNSDIQYIIDCVSYKITRDSAKLCEECGKFGYRRQDNRLPVHPKCLCSLCYILELDDALTNSK